MFKTLYSKVLAQLTTAGVAIDHDACEKSFLGPWTIAIKHDPPLRVVYTVGRDSWLALQAAIPSSFGGNGKWRVLWASYDPSKLKAEQIVEQVRHWLARDLRAELQSWTEQIAKMIKD
jgi:hypothetical protein